ncbi:hypothetical protein CSOJ01_06393 [Colletotrichum sojae]|uniref:Uncharacterized protein n=1 Tax=Colletotrichum sojae TaxID=2175907 RepID=A0A8H6JC86_9PEZI|nr:hypothetical protein CSOJ01_06393 [Colletotrichum sojae]
MAAFAPIDKAISDPSPRSLKDPEPKRFVRHHLRLLAAAHDGSHGYPYCWGFTIFRTAYAPGSGAAFAKAVERLGVHARNYAYGDLVRRRKPNEEPLDRLPNEELAGRYFSEVVEDAEMEGFGVEEVGRRFDAWVRGKIEVRDGRDVPNSRFRLCLMMDQKGIDDVLSLPEDPRDAWGDDVWIKVVTNERWEDRGGSGRGRLWLRADVRNAVWSTWFALEDPDFVYEYVGWSEDESDGALNFWGSPPAIDI